MRIKTLLTTASAMALSLGVMAGGAAADNNDLFVEQVGNNNFGGGSQNTGNNNEGYIQADGNNNSAAFQLTKPGFGAANGNDVLVKATGNKNRVTPTGFDDQDGPLVNNDIGAVTTGDDNVITFNLTGTVTTGLSNTTLFVEQTGDNNFASDSQGVPGESGGTASVGGAGATTTFPDFSSFDLEGPGAAVFPAGGITGSGHFIGLRQDGDNNAMQMTVTGNSNTIRGFVTDPGSASEGSFNGYTNSGSFFDNDTSFSSLPTLAHQDGNNNVGVVQVTGVGNDVQFAQTGNFNTAEVYQDGTGNTTWVGQ